MKHKEQLMQIQQQQTAEDAVLDRASALAQRAGCTLDQALQVLTIVEVQVGDPEFFLPDDADGIKDAEQHMSESL